MRLPIARDYYPIPNSIALAEIRLTQDGMLGAAVRCAADGHRLFDVYECEEFSYWESYSGVSDMTRFLVIRVCPRCATENERFVTARRGKPVGEDGPWKCTHCDGHLARIDAPRGRLTVPCPKCRSTIEHPKADIRVTAADAYQTVKRALDRPEHVDEKRDSPQPAGSGAQDDYEDVPF